MREGPGRRAKIFISYARRDRAWAEWIAWQLEHIETNPFAVELDVWDWAAGRNFVAAMSSALGQADHVVAVLSQAYLESGDYAIEQWADALVQDDGKRDRLIPVRIEPMCSPPLLRARIQADLSGVDEATARQRLFEAVRGPQRPTAAPDFPGPIAPPGGAEAEDVSTGPRLPGALPPIWNIPPANPDFIGRDHVLVELRERLLSGGTAMIQALHGLGGVGKSQLAIE
ncbi:toll/interleukin-1 receptor domain-containing protein, partial [Frankia sp. CcWB3]